MMMDDSSETMLNIIKLDKDVNFRFQWVLVLDIIRQKKVTIQLEKEALNGVSPIMHQDHKLS